MCIARMAHWEGFPKSGHHTINFGYSVHLAIKVHALLFIKRVHLISVGEPCP